MKMFMGNPFLKKNIKNSFGTFCRHIKEGEFEVTPLRTVPKSIKPPNYVGKKNPLFGIYEGIPKAHDLQTQNNLREAGKIAADVLSFARDITKIGMTGEEVDELVHNYIISKDTYPTALGFMHFPKSLCISINDVMCHGIPSKRPFLDGDYVNYDVTIFKNGVHGDNSLMIELGDVDPDISVTQEAVYESIKICKAGVPYKLIGEKCQLIFKSYLREIAELHGYYSNEMFTGHGVGEYLHMPPMVIHAKNDCEDKMEPGHVFTIEPIFLMMKPRGYQFWKDNFTIVSPGNPSAQWEHTILIKEDGSPEVLTLREEEKGKLILPNHLLN